MNRFEKKFQNKTTSTATASAPLRPSCSIEMCNMSLTKSIRPANGLYSIDSTSDTIGLLMTEKIGVRMARPTTLSTKNMPNWRTIGLERESG